MLNEQTIKIAIVSMLFVLTVMVASSSSKAGRALGELAALVAFIGAVVFFVVAILRVFDGEIKAALYRALIGFIMIAVCIDITEKQEAA